MKKAELINAIAEKGGYTKKDAEKALNAVIDSLTDVMVSGDKITLVGFGTFKTKVNPEWEEIPAPRKKSSFPRRPFLYSSPVRL